MKNRRLSRAGAAAAVVLMASGCYSYVPLENPTPGMHVRVAIPVSSPVSRPNQAPEVLSLEGSVVSMGDTLVLQTNSRREYGAFREILEVDTLRVARQSVSLVEQRLLSKPKTYGFTALVTVGAAGLALAAVNTLTGEAGGGKDGGGGTTTVGQRISIPIFSALLKLVGR